ncbi:related to FLR1-Putative H+ antiporter regulated by yAP-1 and involved in multidrug resistance [Phialocephala subalpina]|uniref:Related to FLR1-Putative H+ antiporter regulated by yAP-1 and involved in multidrug resistance n=1 Tax=Phialocephala subalpina TaxID=576137 RepID=A0A1L7X3D6_9HELO|nr:related to FLR1-Putative H+ antiporter regulated by yAP-1 and involved in multidrug resistance [Phialocephala subalpina]
MVWDIVRDSTFGVLVRLATGNKYFSYPEEKADFEFVRYYGDATHPPHPRDESQIDVPEPGPGEAIDGHDARGTPVSDGDEEKANNEKKIEDDDASSTTFDPVSSPWTPPPNSERVSNVLDAEKMERIGGPTDLYNASTRASAANAQGNETNSLGRARSQPIVPVRTTTGTILVDWYETNDQANPMNWSAKKKAFVAFQIDFYTFAVYMASSIYTSSEPGVMAHFGVGSTKAALGLAMYVLGYGLGPLLWSPMSEIPIFGRNVPYVGTFIIYVILCVPTALVDNVGGLLFLRFLTGFFGSPCLANGGASMQDLFSPMYIPYAITIWAAAAFCGPALGPMISGFSVTAKGWRWSLWEILWLSGPVFIFWFFFLPETSADTILLYRARRLRKMTNNSNLQSNSEIKRRHLTFRQIAADAIIKPFEIMFKDPAVLFTNVYTALIYGIYYSFFEAFALVYGPIYGFNLGLTGVAFLTVIIGALITGTCFVCLLHFVVIPQMKVKGPGKQEDVLMPSLIMVIGPPIGLFLFGWTARSSVHWIASLVGIAIYSGSVFIVTLGIFTYIPMSYPPYAASLFAGNDICRSLMAFGAVLYGRPLYMNLGIGPASSLLAGLSFLGVIGIWLLFFFGENLRKRSKFAVH